MAGFASCRGYVRTRMVALGYKEWKDAFNFDNIPDNLLSRKQRMFHIETVSASRSDSYDMESQDVDVDVTLRVFFKGYRQPADAIDAAMTAEDTILEDVLAAANRLGTTVKNVYFNNSAIVPLGETNDNAAILEINLICRIILCV